MSTDILNKRVRLKRSYPTHIDGRKVNKPLRKGEEGVVVQVTPTINGDAVTVQFDGRLFGASGIPVGDLELI